MNKDRLRRILPQPLISLFKIIRGGYRAIFIFYETGIAPFIAFKMSFLLWPIFKACEACNLRFLTNHCDGIGHLVVETDNFFRKQLLNETDPKKKYILIRKSHDMSKQFVSMYRHKYNWAICNSALYYTTLPLLMRHPSLCLDCGLSRSKWHLLKRDEEVRDDALPPWPKILTKHKNLMEWEDRYRRKVKSSHLSPLRDYRNPDKRLDEWIQKCENKKIALIHLKTNTVNATAKITDAATYLPTIEYLTSLDYQLIFVGREKMPEIFKKYKILNYAESKIANFANDVSLFCRADLAITGGSGIFLLAECLNTPLLYINYWHLYRLPASQNAVCIPTLVQDSSRTLLKFSEQWNLYKSANDCRSEVFPAHQYEARNASDDEILSACQELIALNRNAIPLSPLQKKFTSSSDYYFGESRVSEYFLKKHKTLF